LSTTWLGKLINLIPRHFFNSVDAKFSLRLPATVSPNTYIQSLIQETHSADSVFSKALGAREAKYENTLARGVVSLVLQPGDEHCFVGDLFHMVVGGVSQVLRYSVGAVGGAVCEAGATLVGAPEVGVALGPVCSAGATRIYDYVASRVGIDAANVKSSFKTSGKGKRSEVNAVRHLTRQVKKTETTRAGVKSITDNKPMKVQVVNQPKALPPPKQKKAKAKKSKGINVKLG